LIPNGLNDFAGFVLQGQTPRFLWRAAGLPIVLGMVFDGDRLPRFWAAMGCFYYKNFIFVAV
jgi:hypothetical protein